LLWPLLVYSLPLRRLKVVLPILLAANIAFRIIVQRTGMAPADIYHASLTHLDGIIIGSMLPIYWDRVAPLAKRHSGWLLLAIGLSLVALLCTIGTVDFLDRSVQAYGYPLIALFYALFILNTMAGGPFSRWLGSTPMRVLGKYSYCIYLIHWPLMLVLDHVVPGRGPFVWLLYMTGIFLGLVGFGAASWKYFEYPIIRWARQREVRRQPIPRGSVGQ
jgi:peptidoglycan/LPS O-acetylase OafA/YrhL